MTSEEEMEKKRSNSFFRGVLGVIIAIIVYIILPDAIQMCAYPYIGGDFVLDGVTELLDRWVIAGVPLIVLAFPKGFYGMGTRGWLASSVAYHLMKIVWILYVVNFGDLTGVIAVDSADEWVTVDIVLHGFMYLMVAMRLLRLLIVYGDYRDNRHAVRDDDGKRKPDNTTPGDDIRVRGRFN